MANAILNAAGAAPLSVASDPRTGTGLAGIPGQIAYDGTSYYQCVGTGANDWVKVPYYSRTVVSGADVASVTVTGLNGDADRVYHFAVYATMASEQSIYLQPNGAATNCVSVKQFGTHLSTSAVGTLPAAGGWLIGQSRGSSTHILVAEGTVTAASGVRRFGHWHTYETVDDASAYGYVHQGIGCWYDTATNLTSIKFACSGTAISAGSIFTVWTDPTGAKL